jgi:hypothetical protein
MWMNESQLCNMQQWVQLGQLFQANGSGAVNVNNTGFTATVGWLSAPCTVDSTHKANQVIVFGTNGSTQVIPANGGYWDGGFNLGIGRNNPQMDDAWADDYSKTSACTGGLGEDNHFAIYYNGTLLQEWTSASAQDAQTGGEPCCGGTVHSMSFSTGVITGTLASPTPTPVESFTPTPVTLMSVSSVVAAPNMSDGHEPIHFLVSLSQPSKISLKLFTIFGEKVYETQEMGTAGLNTLVWQAQNDSRQAVASGLYLYVVQIGEGQTVLKSGKILIIH